MEAGPRNPESATRDVPGSSDQRDTPDRDPRSRDTGSGQTGSRDTESRQTGSRDTGSQNPGSQDDARGTDYLVQDGPPGDPIGSAGSGAAAPATGGLASGGLTPDGLTSDGLTSDGPDEQDAAEQVAPEVEVELRPRGKFRIWQIAPIVILAGVGSLMFAFPLAFGTGDGGSVIAMLGLLLGCCAAGWGMTAARKVGYTWPGLPTKASGERADWRFVALYVAIAAVVVALAVWRVDRLR